MADPGEIRAAGALLYRHSAGGVEVGLIHRSRYDDWTLPKGKTEPGEHVLATAVREVAEETGITVVLGRKLGQTSYHTVGRAKRVDYWAAQPAPSRSTRFAANAEVDELVWLPLAEAAGRLSYSRDEQLLAEFAAGPADTVPFILLRHVSAGHKGSWPGDDLARPLDERGVADAGLLAGLLACFGQCSVVSSPAERCIATVRPYAQRTGTKIAVEPALTAAPDAADSAAAAALAVEIAARAQPAVLCAHGENLGPALTAVCEYLGSQVPGEARLEKGGFWALHISGQRLAGAEQYRLTADQEVRTR